MFQDEEDTRDLSAEVSSIPKKFQSSIQDDAVRLYQEIKQTEEGNLDLVISGSRPFDPPAVRSMESDTTSPMYGREVARSGGHWIVSLEADSLVEMQCILADARTAATAIVCHTHRLATAQEVEQQAGSNHGTADTVKREVGK